MVQAHGRARMAVGEVQPPAGGTTLPHSVVPFQTSSIPTRAAGHPPALADADGAAVEDSSNPSRPGQNGRPLVDYSHEYSTLPPHQSPNPSRNSRRGARVGWSCGDVASGRQSPPPRSSASACKTVRNSSFPETNVTPQGLATSSSVSIATGADNLSTPFGDSTESSRDGKLSLPSSTNELARGSGNSPQGPATGLSAGIVLHAPHAVADVLTTQHSQDASNAPLVGNTTGCSPPSSGRRDQPTPEDTQPTLRPPPLIAPSECHSIGEHLNTVGDVEEGRSKSPPSPKFSGIRPYPLGRESSRVTTPAFDGSQEYCTMNTVFFWQSPSCFSHWTPSSFIVDGERYNCGEQFFAAAKARMFGDKDTLRQIMRYPNPATHKHLGRKVRGFDQKVWERERENVVLTGNYFKFLQNPRMLRHLLGTKSKTLAEASPTDAIWGIGLRADKAAAVRPSQWPGSNLLGKALMAVRDLLKDQAPPIERNSHVSENAQVKQVIHEVNPATNEPIPLDSAADAAPAGGYSGYTPYAPKDHSEQVLAVNSVEYDSRDSVRLLPEHGPCLVGGIVTVDDATFTTRVKVHAGPATSQYGLAALLDSGSPAIFINSNAGGTLIAMGAVSDKYITRNANRSWGGFGKARSLQTTEMIRLSVQFLHGDRPSASLAIWAHIVPANSMQYPILLGRDSFMRFNTRSYRTLAAKPLDDRVYGEYTFSHHDDQGAVAYVPDSSAPPEQFHLRYAGHSGISLSHEHQMVEVNLVRANGCPALTGQYLVDMFPDVSTEELFVEHRREMFVSEGRQLIPLSGAAELSPGDLLGSASAPLMRVPVHHLQPLNVAPAINSAIHSAVPGPEALGGVDGVGSLQPAVVCEDPFVNHLRAEDSETDRRAARAANSTAPTASDAHPPPELMARLSEEQRQSVLAMWALLPPHMRAIHFDFHGEGWTPEVITTLGGLLHEFQDVFSTSPTDLGCCSLLPFKIVVPPDSTPVTSRPYRMNPLIAKQVDLILDEYLSAGLIQHSTSPYSSPIVVIPKKSGGIRITVNYKKLNSISSLGQLPIPRVEDILTKLNKGAIFSLFDFTGSFHQITVCKDTVPLTAFATPTRLFEWLRMPMGASQSPGWFVKVINEVINGLPGLEAYLDDVVKFDENPAQHVAGMRAFFERLRQHHLKLSPPKATIGTTKADFLGHTISSEGVLPNARKVEALAKMPMPTNIKALRSLMGGLSYYRRFLKSMAKRVRPVTALLKKGVPFVFTSEMETIVRELLAELAKPPILVFPDWDAIEDNSRPLLLCCDASADGLGATLEQKQKDGSVKPIVFISRATLDAERNWTALDLEAGAIVWSIKRLREYLRGTTFCILSDNKALENMHKISEHNPRVQRWIEFLSAYQYTLKHRSGAANGNADMLSRLPLPATDEDKTGFSRITSPDDVGVYVIASTGRSSSTHTIPGVDLGGGVPHDQSVALGGLPLTDEDFGDFRQHGPRMRIDDLDTPSGVFAVRAFPCVNTKGPLRHLKGAAHHAAAAEKCAALKASIPGENPETTAAPIFRSPAPAPRTACCALAPSVLPGAPRTALRALAPSVFPVEDTAASALPGPTIAALAPPLAAPQEADFSSSDFGSQAPPLLPQGTAAVAGDAQRLDVPASPPPPSASRGRPTRLIPTELVSTRTRSRNAAAAGASRPPVNYGFAPEPSPPPRARPAARRAPRQNRPKAPPRSDLERPAGPRPTALPAPSSPPIAQPAPTDVIDPPPASEAVPAAPSVDAMVLSAAETKFRDAVGNFTRADWAREQQLEFECNACIRYILLDRPDTLPPDFFDGVPSHRQTPFSEIKELADKGHVVFDDGSCLLVRRPTKPPAANSGRPEGRQARHLDDEPTRIYVPMRMRPWVMHPIHGKALCHLGSARTLSLLERFYWRIGMNAATRFWIGQESDVSSPKGFASDHSLANSHDSPAVGTWHSH